MKTLLINNWIAYFGSKRLNVEFEIKLYKVKGFVTQLIKQGVVKCEGEIGNCTSICACTSLYKDGEDYFIVTDEYLYKMQKDMLTTK